MWTLLYDPIADLSLELPLRQGRPPRTGRMVPYVQLDQWPSREIAEEFVSRCLRLPCVKSRESRMASPRSRALWLPDELAGGPSEAFIDANEFCHLHPPPEAGIHMTLPEETRGLAVGMGWAAPHPIACLGAMPASLVMVYAPRNREEMAVALRLVRSSYDFARGPV
jgi:hypothetical protein